MTFEIKNPVQHEQSHQTDYEAFFRYAPIPIIEIDGQGNITKLNQNAETLFSKFTVDLHKINLIELSSNDSKEILADFFKQLVEKDLKIKNKIESRFQISDSDFSTLLFKFSLVKVSEERPARIICVVEDISKFKEEEEYIRRHFQELQLVKDDLEQRTSELAYLNEKLHESEMQLEEMNNNKNKFFSIISHDLRSPFNSLLGLTQMILEDFDDFSREDIKESVYNLYQVSEGLYKLIEDLLDWSKIQFNKTVFEPEYFNLNEAAGYVVNTLKSVARDKNLSVVNLVSKNCTIYADKQMIITTLRNLLNNSIKFTPKYGLIKISAGYDLEDLIISVEDTGVGMSPKKAENLFVMGSKVSTAGTQGEKGTGLGLLICKEFIEKHGGKIWVRSEEGKGSTFFLRIPLERKNDEESELEV